jgi:hypothetical protein
MKYTEAAHQRFKRRYAQTMSLWKAVEDELATIGIALAAGPPNVTEAQQLVAALALKVKNRQIPASRTFSVDELKKPVEHLAFETQHFRCYSKLYKSADPSRLSDAATQAVQYALLLHLRLLIDFFYGEAKQDDCHVDHFNILDGFEATFPASLRPHSAQIKKLSLDLNKLLAHLTATRWEKNRPPMNDYDKFIPRIDDLITKFEAALPEEVRQVYLKHYRHWERYHPATVRQQGHVTHGR